MLRKLKCTYHLTNLDQISDEIHLTINNRVISSAGISPHILLHLADYCMPYSLYNNAVNPSEMGAYFTHLPVIP